MIHSLLPRLVAEINSERKLKSQKARPKTSEGRMHLSNVRIIQRNLVYIIGLPLNLADESVSSFYISIHLIIPSVWIYSGCSYTIYLLLLFVSIFKFLSWVLWFLSASSAKRVLWPIWKGSEGVYFSNCNWGYSTCFKQQLLCVSSLAICLSNTLSLPYIRLKLALQLGMLLYCRNL